LCAKKKTVTRDSAQKIQPGLQQAGSQQQQQKEKKNRLPRAFTQRDLWLSSQKSLLYMASTMTSWIAACCSFSVFHGDVIGSIYPKKTRKEKYIFTRVGGG
jgi:hypothetical protein